MMNILMLLDWPAIICGIAVLAAYEAVQWLDRKAEEWEQK